jgi:hypothetical protein
MVPQEPALDEPLKQTLRRTVSIAAVVGLVIALSGHNLRAWPLVTLLVLWFSLGGHYLEVWFLTSVRPRVPNARAIQAAARLVTWFVGGVALAGGMALTVRVLVGFWRAPFPAWYWGGLVFVGVELVAHLVLQLRGRASFYNARG